MNGDWVAPAEQDTVVLLYQHALEICRKYSLAGKEIPAEELQELRERLHNLEKKEFNGLRAEIGALALRGEIKVGDKDAGLEIMRILFGERDCALLKNTGVLISALDITLRDYRLSTIVDTLGRFGEWVRGGGPAELSPEERDELLRAERAICRRVEEIGPAKERERLEIFLEVSRQGTLVREVEEVWSRLSSIPERKAEILRLSGLLRQAWQNSKELPFEAAELQVRKILRIKRALDELKKSVKKVKSPADKHEFTEGNLRASALEASARVLLSERGRKEEVIKRAEEYLAEADLLLAASSRKGGER